ncbi:hypothetical protein F5Y16DRAFT_150403 [Xylariaceae sp. FL0255]|nr:hypothetical protein F5Y16DRAFT_150403 [Xylariaceae sp. FL0255]
MSAVALSSASSVQPVKGLEDAVHKFRSILTTEQQDELLGIRDVPDADSILVFTAQLDATNRSHQGQSVGSRVFTVLQSVQQFCTVVDTFVSSNPRIAALVWGSVRLTMQIVLNYTSYYEAVCDLFMQFGHLCPLFAEYATLYQSSKSLQKALSEFQASIVRCCEHVVRAIQRPWHNQLLTAFYKSFDQEFRLDKEDIQRCSDKVQNAIGLAQAHIEIQERAAASQSRKFLSVFASRADANAAELRELVLLREKRAATRRKQRLLDSFCSHRPEKLLKQNQRKRFRNTASWIFQSSEFREWIDSNGSPLLWCSGKIGSGKSVLAASVVDYLLVTKGPPDHSMSYFFIDFGDRNTLKIETFLRSIIRQRLPQATKISDETESELRNLQEDDDLPSMTAFIGKLMDPSETAFLIIDGLDEYEDPSRAELLQELTNLLGSSANTKLFLSGRESLTQEIERFFKSFNQVSTKTGAQRDMADYVKGTIQKKLDLGELNVGDPELVSEVETALIEGSDGMFLWVFFQVLEICEQSCDEDIRKTIAHLPKDLKDTFQRIINRISSKSSKKMTRKIFQWVAASARPLTLGELREAIAVEVNQEYSMPERLCNNVNTIVQVCENLIYVDEEDHSVSFAHHTIKQFLLQKPVGSNSDGLFINLGEADVYLGEICVTYLDFNDFKTTLSRRQQDLKLPYDIGLRSLPPTLKKTVERGQKLISKARNTEPVKVNRLITSNATATTEDSHSAHPFLRYAEIHWITHSKQFQPEETKIWAIWRSLLSIAHETAKKPWSIDQADVANRATMRWAIKAHHHALLEHILSSRRYRLWEDETNMLLAEVLETNDIVMLSLGLESDMAEKVTTKALFEAARLNNLPILNALVAAEININAQIVGDDSYTKLDMGVGEDPTPRSWVPYSHHDQATIVTRVAIAGPLPLEVAAHYGSREAAVRLLELEAKSTEWMFGAKVKNRHLETNARAKAALYEAAYAGYLGVLEALLTANCQPDHMSLRFAAFGGSLQVVERLLTAGVRVDDPDSQTNEGYYMVEKSPLWAAAYCGNLRVFEILSAAGNNRYLTNKLNSGKLLWAAAHGGCIEIVNRLLAAGAEARDAEFNESTALYSASSAGHLNIVKRLFDAGANFNLAQDTRRTALWGATCGGHFEVLEYLLKDDLWFDGGAHLSATRLGQHLISCIEEAAKIGHTRILEKLLAQNRVLDGRVYHNGYEVPVKINHASLSNSRMISNKEFRKLLSHDFSDYQLQRSPRLC